MGSMTPIQKRLQTWCGIRLRLTVQAAETTDFGLQSKIKHKRFVITPQREHSGPISMMFRCHDFNHVTNNFPLFVGTRSSHVTHRFWTRLPEEVRWAARRSFWEAEGTKHWQFFHSRFFVGEPTKSSWRRNSLSWPIQCSKLSRRLAQLQFSADCALNHAPYSWQRWKLNQNVRTHHNPFGSYLLWRSRVDLMRKERNCQAFLTHLSSSRRTHSLTLCTTLLKVATLCTCIPVSVIPGRMRCKRNPKANQKPWSRWNRERSSRLWCLIYRT